MSGADVCNRANQILILRGTIQCSTYRSAVNSFYSIHCVVPQKCEYMAKHNSPRDVVLEPASVSKTFEKNLPSSFFTTEAFINTRVCDYF